VLEVAFGGGEPMLFPHWPEFIIELYATTRLGINFTTNGTLLTEDFLQAIAGKYGQIRVSLYEDNHWPETLALLSQCQARFGVNWLITPAELDGLEAKFMRLLTLGVRDFLLLSYKGDDSSLHLTSADRQRLAAFVNKVYRQLGAMVQIKLDSCWGDSLLDVPRLFDEPDCGAGDDFLSITSDKHVKVCSFQRTKTGIPFESVADLRRIWETRRAMRQPALIAGCARLPNRGLSESEVNHAYINLATIQ
jgi:MoaA/NifB/PqqE/SkfB family radical SAM enzyme